GEGGEGGGGGGDGDRLPACRLERTGLAHGQVRGVRQEDGPGNGCPRRSAEPLAAEDGDRGGPGGAEEAAPIEQAFRRRRNRKGVIAAHHRHSSRCSSACDRGARPVARTARTSVG